MSESIPQFEQRKRDHIALALLPENQANGYQDFDAIHLQHDALPDLDVQDIRLSTTRLGRSVAKPFFISSMTAGHQQAIDLNARLMEAASNMAWAMGVGSQRRELFDTDGFGEWSALRKQFPNVSIMSNIGIAQLITTHIDGIEKLVDTLAADGLIVHCNPLQEMIQSEGTPQFKGAWKALAHTVEKLSVPVIVKETGCGFSLSTLKRLHEVGVAAVDVSGLGGTHWGRIEGKRAVADKIRQRASETFADWGVTTVRSVQLAASLSPCYEIWGSGGVRHGLDAAKLFALGALNVGFAKPMLEAALTSVEAIVELMQTIEYELKVALLCTGSASLSALKEKLRC